MHALRRSRQRRPGTGLCENLSDRGYPLRHQEGDAGAGGTARGYEHAGVYNPEGVGGTHVMYVLHHADQPELYHGLPKDPKIDTSVSLWKGALKPLAAAGFIATFAGLIFHYIGIGPNKEVDDDEEDHHE